MPRSKRLRLPLLAVDMPWRGGVHRFFTWFFTACLALYLTYATFVSRSDLFVSLAATVAALLWALLIFAGYFVGLIWLWGAFQAPARQTERKPLRLSVLIAGTAMSLCILGVYLMASDPGGVTVDSAVQWTQASTGRFSNWHPVFHTLLLWLCAHIKPDYTFALAIQCGVFSLSLGYLLATLVAWGVKRLPLFITAGMLVASPIVGHTMMYLWKDNAMTIGVVVLTAYVVNLYLSHGAWLGKTRNAIVFGLALAFTTLVRHNAILFTLPLLITAMLTCRAQLRYTLVALTTLVVALGLVWGPLYSALQVSYPNNTLEESIGVPMTIVSNIRKVNPDALDPETRAFTDDMASDAGWEAYSLNNYNSIKFGAMRELVTHTTLPQILRMAASAAKADPRNAFLAVNGVTDLVWGLADEGAANLNVRNSGDLPSVPRGVQGRLNRSGEAIKAMLTAPLKLAPVSWYVGNLGVSFALLLVFALRALRRSGVRALLLCLPTLLYNLGTMCVLCGQDARFFSFSPLVGTLMLFVLVRDVANPDIVTDRKVIE